MNEGTRSGKSTIRLIGISAERPTNGLYLLPFLGCRNWKIAALNRKGWKKLLEEAEAHPGL
jgi:hypothetical protein